MNKISHEDIVLSVKRDFPENQVEKVLEMLDEYGKGPKESEITMVWMAILQMSNKDVEKVKMWVQEAKADYKNVLFWAS